MSKHKSKNGRCKILIAIRELSLRFAFTRVRAISKRESTIDGSRLKPKPKQRHNTSQNETGKKCQAEKQNQIWVFTDSKATIFITQFVIYLVLFLFFFLLLITFPTRLSA